MASGWLDVSGASLLAANLDGVQLHKYCLLEQCRICVNAALAAMLAALCLDCGGKGLVLSDAILRAAVLHLSRPMLARLPSSWLLAIVLIVALCLRVAAGAWWQERLPEGKKFGFGDSEGYWELGRTIARGQEYAYGPARLRIFRTPGYPLLLAPLFLLAEEPPVFWGRLLSAVLTTAAVGALAWLARLIFDARTALVAAALAAVYPEAIAAGAFILSEAPFTPLMILNLALWTKAWHSSGTRQVGWSLMAGVAAGLATLVRPSWLLFVPFAGMIGVALTADRPKQLAIGGLMLAGLCLAMLPWWIRNYHVAGRFVPTSLQVGASLYDGLSPIATGASNMEFVGPFVAEQRAADAAAASPPQNLFEDRLDRRMQAESLDWARNHPRRVLELIGVKLLRMWSPVPNAGEFQSTSLRLLLAATYTPIMILTAIGIWRCFRDSRRIAWPVVLCCLPAIYLTLLHVVFVSSIRYRQPAMLPLMMFAAAALTSFIPARQSVSAH